MFKKILSPGRKEKFHAAGKTKIYKSKMEKCANICREKTRRSP